MPSLGRQFRRGPEHREAEPKQQLQRQPAYPGNTETPGPAPSPSFMGRCSSCGFCRNLYPSPARHMATGPQKPRSTGTRTDPYTFTRCERHHRAVQSGTRRFHLCQSRQGFHRCPSLLPLSEPQAGRARVCPHPAGRTFQPATESIPHSAGTPHHLHGKSPVADIGRQDFAPVARTPGRLAAATPCSTTEPNAVLLPPTTSISRPYARKMCPSSANGKN